MAQFFWIPYVKGPIFLTSWYMHIFFAQRFFEAAYPLGITWIDCDICVTTSKNGYKNKSKGSIWIGQHFGYMNGSVFSKTRYMNGVVFKILARTPVPKLQCTSKLPIPELKSGHSERCEAVFFKNFSVTIYYRSSFFFFLFPFFLLFLNLIYVFLCILLFYYLLLFYYVWSLVLLIFFSFFIFVLSYIFFIH